MTRSQRRTIEDLGDRTSTPVRSVRVRHAPDRYTAADFSGQHGRRSSNTKGKERATRTSDTRQEKWAKELEDCEEEEQFVANYSYNHVGQAITEENPYPYIDVPVLEPRLVCK